MTQDAQPIIVPTGSPSPQQQGGYISTSYYGNESMKQQEALAKEGQDAATIQEVSERLGIDPNQLGDPNITPGTQEGDVGDFIKKFNTEEGQRFRNQFKEYMGLDPLEAYQVINDTARLTKELESWRSEVVRQRETEVLKQEFGHEFDTLMPEVVEYFKGLPPAQQQVLDNLDGARMIAALIRQQKSNQMTRGGVGTPPFVQGNVRSLNNRTNAPTVRMSDMVNMSGAELDRHMSDILKAKQAGTFIYDL